MIFLSVLFGPWSISPLLRCGILSDHGVNPNGDEAALTGDNSAGSTAPASSVSPPLIQCIRCRSESMVEVLLQGGADPNLADWEMTPLEHAVVHNLPKVIALLKKYGADLNHHHPKRGSPLRFAIFIRSSLSIHSSIEEKGGHWHSS